MIRPFVLFIFVPTLLFGQDDRKPSFFDEADIEKIPYYAAGICAAGAVWSSWRAYNSYQNMKKMHYDASFNKKVKEELTPPLSNNFIVKNNQYQDQWNQSYYRQYEFRLRMDIAQTIVNTTAAVVIVIATVLGK